jgi:tetratricopeptide (TPR) repeat protein
MYRPQPLGVWPWPTGMLVLPEGPGTAEVAALMLRGIQPETWPDHLRFVAASLAGDPAAAAALVGDDPIGRYNAAVLIGGDGAWDQVIDTDADLAALVGVATFSVGLLDAPPPVAEVSGEIAAIVRSAHASAALERNDLSAALAALEDAGEAAAAAGSMILAASLLATRAELLREQLGDAQGAIEQVDAALRLIPRMVADEERFYPPAELWGELHVTRALARQERATANPGLLLSVTQDLTEALKVFTEEDHPEQFAACNSHLALAYLVMPMSSEGDRLRVGVAVTSLRAALRVYQPQTHPDLWASTQMNLANALQYLPSVHQEQNLDEAVHLYEQLLTYRTPDVDPLGVARILANQGNALGHLGVFSDARERLTQARDLFSQCDDDDGVATVDELLANVEQAALGAAG